PSESSRNRASQKHRATPPPAIVPPVLEGGTEIIAAGESQVQPNLKDGSELKSECVPPVHSDSSSVVLSHAVIQPRRSYISILVRRKVWQRANNQCEFVNPLGQRCAAQYALELDHVQPVSQGGTDDFSNLRILCKNHNCYQAKIILGAAAMQPYLPSLR
ncbi:MAG: HNH endonuclease signature motif containing protein, partial [Bdellovibrionia bacterium]